MTRLKQKHHIRKHARHLRLFVAGIGLVVTLMLTAVPLPTHATIPVIDPAGLGKTILEQIDKITWRAIEDAAGAAFKNAIRTFLTNLAYDTAVWIGSGDKNQKPLLFTQSYDDYLREAGDAAVGEVLNTFASETGLADNGLCQLPGLQLGAISSLFAKPTKPNCNFTDIINTFSNAADSYGDALSGLSASFAVDPQAITNYNTTLVEGNVGGATFLDAVGLAFNQKNFSEDIAKLERRTGFKDKESKVAENIETPAEAVEAQSDRAQDEATKAETTFTKSLAGDIVTIFTSTLSAQLLKRLMAGLVPSQSGSGSSSLADSLSGDSSTTGVTGGITQAKEFYAEFRTPKFTSSGTLNILNDFATCPDEGAQVTNCVVDEKLRSAIEQGFSVQQALDAGVLSRDTPFAFHSDGTIIDSPVKGISYRNIQILKQYSVVPVGWTLAAEYMRDFGNIVALGALVDAFTQCGSDSYSPFCGLVDPNWILKAPEVFCAAQGFGNDILSSDFIDFDGDPSTPQQQNILRSETCLNPQSCLSENNNSDCEAYGYCTKQQPIYRFQGDECPAYFASCETYTNDTGESAPLLSNTLNFNDCNTDNAGCQWYCTQWNSVDAAFQCASQGEVFTTCATSDGCSCSTGGETCTIANGGFHCTTSSGVECTLGTVSEADAQVDAALNFDRDVAECDSSENGCEELIPVKGGANLLMNSSFEEVNTHHDAIDAGSEIGDTISDTFGFDINGNPCGSKSDTTPSNCYGWIFRLDGEGFAIAESAHGLVGLRLPQAPAGGAYVAQSVNTGQPIANRTFTLSFQYKNVTGNSDCRGQYWFREGNGTTFTTDVVYGTADALTPFVSEAFTYGPTDGATGGPLTTPSVHIGIDFPLNCEIVLDAVQLEENLNPTDYQPYGATTLSLNTTTAPTCSVDDIGCELYTPNTGESRTPVPGLITNPNAAVCDDITNPECSQCVEEFVGCDAYIEVPTPYTAPLNDESGFVSGAPPSADVRLAIAKRKGLYCENDQSKACLSSADCDGLACVNSLSLVPSQGQTCSAASVGCEQYINLDEQAAGGEGVEHYTYLKQCVKETQAQLSRGELDTFYTFEGSDVTGYQLRSWYLKKSNSDNGPCTNLDYYGATAETAEAACVDDVVGVLECSFGTDPDCQAFYSAQGELFYRPQTATISVSDDCHPLRNTLDNRIYYSIPKESIACSANDNLCREYRGSEGGNVEIIINENFDNGVWYGGESSSTTVTAGQGQSMALGSGTASGSHRAEVGLTDSMQSQLSYVVTFWAKGDDAQVLLPYILSALDSDLTAGSTSADVRSSDAYYEFTGNTIQLTNEWQRYTVGPLVYTGEVTSNEIFGIVYDGATAYIDNVELQKSNSQYLVAGSAPLCLGYEGCEQYADRLSSVHYLKSFQSLCDENVVGCQALLQTENSNTPYPTLYNGNNEYTQDDVAVDADHPVSYSAQEGRAQQTTPPTPTEWSDFTTYAVRDEFRCGADVVGCQQFGQPDIDEQSTTVTGFTERFFINDPDQYSSILCQEQQMACQEYSTSDGSVVYFKDPGSRTCTFDTTQGKWIKVDGSDCPLRNGNPAAAPSQPAGPLCNGGLRAGEFCSSDSDCPSTDTTVYRCITPEENETSGTITGQTSTGAVVSIPYASSEFGWAGICGDQYAGCRLYADPNSLNAEEFVVNGSFEVDEEDNNDRTSATPDEVPDDWSSALSNYYKPDGEPLNRKCTLSGVPPDGQAKRFSTYAFDGLYALVVGECSFGTADFIPVDSTHSYTLAANVLPNVGYDHSGHNDLSFSVGLLYYDQNLNEVSVGDDPEDYAVAAYEGTNRSTRATEPFREKLWHRYYATIGPNLQNEIPDNVRYVRVFLETSAAHYVYYDNVSLKANDEYTYINATVDGAAESDVNSCNGIVKTEDGCVAFRDTTNNSLQYLSSIQKEVSIRSDFTFAPCTFDSALADEACSSRLNTADSNSVIKVRRDRECAEWLACSSARNNIDASGNTVDSTCLDIGLCTKRNSETGVCIAWASKEYPQTIGYDDDVLVTAGPDNNNALPSIQNISGYATVGMAWTGTCDGNSGTCIGGQNPGASCTTTTDCQSLVVQGHYQYHEAPQRGLGGSGTTNEIIPDNDFEDVFCDGFSDYSSVSQYQGIDAVENSRDDSLHCTLDAHCRTTDTDQTVEDLLSEQGASASVANIPYEEGWCRNVEAGVWNAWQTYGETAESKATAAIVDYDAALDYEVDNKQGTISARNLDLNNVLSVTPSSNLFSGVQVDIGETLTPGQEYVMSFDAQYTANPKAETDFIQVGALHSGSGYDFWEVGSAMADIVFLVDASSSMGAYIDSVAANTTTLVQELKNQGIDFQMGIVTTGGSRQPEMLDFADYTSGPGTEYGATDGITTDFITDTSTFAAAMSFIADNLDGGTAKNYQGLDQVADNTIGADSNSFTYRPGAKRFVVLLTDVAPESDPVSKDDILSETIPYTLYGITTTPTAQDAYQAIIDQTGGQWYSITSSDYGDLLTAITEDIAEKTSSFTLTTNYEHYTLGPIIISGKKKASETSQVIFGQTRGSNNTSFVIDNVSLKPALEVNKEDNPHSEIATNLVGRECRGYPEDDARQCDYQDDNGIFFEGWKGYCLEHDAVDNSKCIAWWPVDVIAGEKDQTHRAQAVYTNKVPAYYCLVAKGNSNLGACTDDETLCGGNTYCANSQCVGNGYDDYATTHRGLDDGHHQDNNRQDLAHHIATGDYQVTHTIPSLPLHTGHDDSDYQGTFVKIEPNALEKNIHISEIDHMVFDKGIPNKGEKYWAGVQTIDTRELELTNKAEPLMLYDFQKDNDSGLFIGYNTGIWCGNLPCTSESIRDHLDGELAFIFTQAIATDADNDQNRSAPSALCGAASRIDTDRDDNGDCQPYNPFTDAALDIEEGDSMWNAGGCHGTIDFAFDTEHVDNRSDSIFSLNCGDRTQEEFNKDQFGDANQIYMMMKFKDGYLDAIYLGYLRTDVPGDPPGVIENISWTFALKEPCLLAVEAVSQDAETVPWQTRVRNGSTYLLKALKLSQSNLGGLSKMFGSLGNDVRGLTPDRIDGDQEDFSNTQFVDWTAAGPNDLPMQYLNNAVGSGIPTTCIGWCDTTVCEANYDPNVVLYGRDSCPSNLWIGRGHGYCQDTATGDPIINVSGEVERCVEYNNVVSGCSTPDAECADIGAGSGFDKDAGSYEEQLNNAAADGWDRLRLIFADIGNTVWYAAQDSNNAARFQPYLTALSNPQATLTGFDENSNGSFDFDDPATLKECLSSGRGDADYCGIRPRVRNMQVVDPDGQTHTTSNVEIDHGESVTLVFDSAADLDQEPVQTIRIAWEGEDAAQDFDKEYFLSDPWEAASSVGHTYSHVYTCDPKDPTVQYDDDPNGDGDPSDARCVYAIKIQIQDNWRFCSGTQQTAVVRNTEDVCTSYDQLSAKIYVHPPQ